MTLAHEYEAQFTWRHWSRLLAAAPLLTVRNEFTVPDQELSFTGSAAPDIVGAWRARFDRLSRLQTLLGEDFAGVRDEFLQCLRRPDHPSTAKVYCVVARAGAAHP